VPGRGAAQRFKVGVSSVIRWCMQLRQTGDLAPRRQGGNRRSSRVEAQADFILGRIAAKRDLTLMELQRELLARGARVSIGALWRFFDRRQITLKKRRRMHPSRTVPTSPSSASAGAS
jgi:transposase